MVAAVERELRLEAPDAFSLARLDIQIEPYRVSPPTLKRLHTVYYDTPERRLTRRGVSLCYRFDVGWTLKLPQPQAGEAAYRTEHTFGAPPNSIPADALRLVAGILRGEPVAAVIELRTLRTSRRVSCSDREIAQIVEDDVHVVQSSAALDGFRQVEIELTRDAPDDALDLLARGLQRYGVGKPNLIPNIVLALGKDASTAELQTPQVQEHARAGDVARAALTAAVDRLIGTDPALRAGLNADAVHDARVAIRRLRSHLRTFEPLFDAGWSRELRSCLRWLGDAFGAARDGDVLLDDVVRYAQALPAADRRDLGPTIELLRARRDQRYLELTAALCERRYFELLDALVLAATAPRFNARAEKPAHQQVSDLYAPVWKQLGKRVRNVKGIPQDRDLHGIRIKAKNARYAAEALAPVVGARATRLAECLERLQTTLGAQHDAVNVCAELRQLAQGGTPALVLGELTAAAHARAENDRDSWRPLWAAAKRRHKRFAA
jgi:CHAD domain-containing protein